MPRALAGDESASVQMPWPRVLVITPTARGCFLDRFASNGESAGDTWHQDLDEAREQALDEYNGSLGPWKEVPQEVNDSELIEFALHSSGQP